MRQIAEEKQLPADIEAEPLVRAAAALQPVIRSHRDEIDREQRLPKTLVEQFHAAGFYNMTIPRELGGLQVDPLTYLRVVELLAEAAGSVGWNLCNNSIAQLVTRMLVGDDQVVGQPRLILEQDAELIQDRMSPADLRQANQLRVPYQQLVRREGAVARLADGVDLGAGFGDLDTATVKRICQEVAQPAIRLGDVAGHLSR